MSNLESALPVSVAGPAPALEARVLQAMPEVERWFRTQFRSHTPPFYGSVDVRNAGYKLAPVDMNLFPGGFNNLSEDALPCAVQAAQAAVDRIAPDVRDLLLVPERHTRNQFYLSSVARLSTILRHAGLTVRLGTLSDEIRTATELVLPDGQTLLVEPLVRRGDRVGLAQSAGGPAFDPGVVILNNDLSAGIPAILRDLDPAQALRPPLHAGWAVRRKSVHFAAYDDVAEAFAGVLGIDPWTINPYFARCGEVDFQERRGEECVAANVDDVLARVAAKYREHGIDEKPFVIVKADAGTYGMGIMTIRDASEVRDLNRRQRNKMAVVKEGLQVQQVIIQEGVPTRETLEGATAEPVVYMIDRFVAGGFYRVHKERGTDENLNAPGMHFVPVPFSGSCNMPDVSCAGAGSAPNRFYAYGVVARLALLAAAHELERTRDKMPSSAIAGRSDDGVVAVAGPDSGSANAGNGTGSGMRSTRSTPISM
jgi:glutamate--cysteine ligase